MSYLIGIDDAGRGPAIGPMILAGIIILKENEKKLKELGAVDSKLLTPKKRKLIGDKLKAEFKYHFEITSPREIDDCDNLNSLEAIKAAMIINKLSEGIKEKIEVIIDCPSVNIKAWQAEVEKYLSRSEIKIKAEHKADFNHPVVSAASIIAKETREIEVEKIIKELGNIGSGYPSDPNTKEFLEKNLENPKAQQYIRHSWATIKNLKNKEDQKKLF
jgi:ribonuclease HII